MNLTLTARMEKNKSLAHAGYLIGALLFVIPLCDTLMRVWPMQFGNQNWRFQIVGGLSSITLVPLIGFLVGLVATVYVGIDRARRSIGVFCFALVAMLVILAALFIVDYFRLRASFQPRFQQAAMIASTTAVVKFVATIVVLALLGLAGLDRAGFRRA